LFSRLLAVISLRHALARERLIVSADDSHYRLGQSPSTKKKFFTESVENPVEKTDENGSAPRQSEEISRLHYRGAIHARVNPVDKKPTDYTVNIT
jgi:hypothetical protein